MRAKLVGALALTCSVIAAAATPAWCEDRTPTAITDIRQETGERQTRLIVSCTGPLAYTYYTPDPLTLVVDVPEVDSSKVPARINVGTAEVESVRVTNMARADGRSLARLEVRLASLVPYQIFSKGSDLNLVFERPASTAAASAPAAPDPAPRAPAGLPAAATELMTAAVAAEAPPVEKPVEHEAHAAPAAPAPAVEPAPAPTSGAGSSATNTRFAP